MCKSGESIILKNKTIIADHPKTILATRCAVILTRIAQVEKLKNMTQTLTKILWQIRANLPSLATKMCHYCLDQDHKAWALTWALTPTIKICRIKDVTLKIVKLVMRTCKCLKTQRFPMV